MNEKDILREEEEQAAEEVERRERMEKQTVFVREMVFLVLLIVFSVAVLIGSIQMWKPDFGWNAAGMYPTLTSGGMLLCSLISMVQLLWKKRDIAVWEGAGAWNRVQITLGTEIPFVVLVMIIATILYVVAIDIVGFYIVTFVYLAFSIFFLFKGKKEMIRHALLVSAGTVLAIYLIIEKLFQIKMP